MGGSIKKLFPQISQLCYFYTYFHYTLGFRTGGAAASPTKSPTKQNDVSKWVKLVYVIGLLGTKVLVSYIFLHLKIIYDFIYNLHVYLI